jgi:hypothetical protein
VFATLIGTALDQRNVAHPSHPLSRGNCPPSSAGRRQDVALDALRCLKRRVADVVYWTMLLDLRAGEPGT